MTKLTLFNKLFILFFALLIVLIIWKVPHEGKSDKKNSQKSMVEMQE
jgi:exopolysaccharide biosynthesis protein